MRPDVFVLITHMAHCHCYAWLCVCVSVAVADCVCVCVGSCVRRWVLRFIPATDNVEELRATKTENRIIQLAQFRPEKRRVRECGCSLSFACPIYRRALLFMFSLSLFCSCSRFQLPSVDLFTFSLFATHSCLEGFLLVFPYWFCHEGICARLPMPVYMCYAFLLLVLLCAAYS